MDPDEADVWFPHKVVGASIRGDSLINAWREYTGLTLADAMGLSVEQLNRLRRFL